MPPIVSDEYKEKRKQEIYDSALTCFAEKGYHTTTIEDIVNHSGISKGAIYNYFKSKEEIYIGLLEFRTGLMLAHLKESFTTIERAEEKIRFLFQAYIDHEKNKDVIRVQMDFSLHASKQEDLQALVKERYELQYKKFFADIIEEGKKSGEFLPSVDSNLISAMIWVLIDGIGLEYCVLGADFPFNRLMKQAEEMIIRTLKDR